MNEMRRRNNQPVIRLRCAREHVVDLDPADVAITHSAGVVTGVSYFCTGCREDVHRELGPELLATIESTGVKIDREARPSTPNNTVGEHRRLISFRMLLDQGLEAVLSDADAGADAVPAKRIGPAPSVEVVVPRRSPFRRGSRTR
jgi:hypothetical protein